MRRAGGMLSAEAARLQLLHITRQAVDKTPPGANAFLPFGKGEIGSTHERSFTNMRQFLVYLGRHQSLRRIFRPVGHS